MSVTLDSGITLPSTIRYRDRVLMKSADTASYAGYERGFIFIHEVVPHRLCDSIPSIRGKQPEAIKAYCGALMMFAV